MNYICVKNLLGANTTHWNSVSFILVKNFINFITETNFNILFKIKDRSDVIPL